MQICERGTLRPPRKFSSIGGIAGEAETVLALRPVVALGRTVKCNLFSGCDCISGLIFFPASFYRISHK
jgi:hypothetical protein